MKKLKILLVSFVIMCLSFNFIACVNKGGDKLEKLTDAQALTLIDGYQAPTNFKADLSAAINLAAAGTSVSMTMTASVVTAGNKAHITVNGSSQLADTIAAITGMPISSGEAWLDLDGEKAYVDVKGAGENGSDLKGYMDLSDYLTEVAVPDVSAEASVRELIITAISSAAEVTAEEATEILNDVLEALDGKVSFDNDGNIKLSQLVAALCNYKNEYKNNKNIFTVSLNVDKLVDIMADVSEVFGKVPTEAEKQAMKDILAILETVSFSFTLGANYFEKFIVSVDVKAIIEAMGEAAEATETMVDMYDAFDVTLTMDFTVGGQSVTLPTVNSTWVDLSELFAPGAIVEEPVKS